LEGQSVARRSLGVGRHGRVIALGFALAASIFPLTRSIDDRSFGSPMLWLGLVLAFAVAEHSAIHLPLRRSAHSLPLDELPFVIGLVFINPLGLLTARIVGGAVGIMADRNTSMGRRWFGIAQYGASAALGITVAEAIAPGRGFATPAEWVAVGAGTLVAGIVGLFAVLAAITLSEGAPDARALSHSVVSSITITSVNVSVGVLAAFIAIADPRALVLLVPVALFSVIGYHAYVDANRHLTQLELTNEMLRAAALADGPEAALAGLLEHTAEALHATTATTILLSTDGNSPPWQMVVDAGSVTVTTLRTGDADAVRKDLASNRMSSRASADVGPALVAHLHGEQGVEGLLAVSGRHDSAGPFTSTDRTLLDAVALQATAIMRRTRLEQMLEVATESHGRLAHEATHDALTSLANRRLLMAELEDRADASTPTSVLLIDLDEFKPVNDQFGHTVGDELLCNVAERLLAFAGDGDLVARLGGDEFAIVRDSIPAARARNTISAELARLLAEPYLTSAGVITIGASVGSATTEPGVSGRNLLAMADQAMYETKRTNAAARIRQP
jgi:diguanylate cyclase (GGDEF)-like protein